MITMTKRNGNCFLVLAQRGVRLAFRIRPHFSAF